MTMLESPESIADSLVGEMGLKGVARVRAKEVAVRAIETRDKQLRERMLWEAGSAARLKFHRSVSMLFEAVACDLGSPHGAVAMRLGSPAPEVLRDEGVLDPPQTALKPGPG